MAFGAGTAVLPSPWLTRNGDRLERDLHGYHTGASKRIVRYNRESLSMYVESPPHTTPR